MKNEDQRYKINGKKQLHDFLTEQADENQRNKHLQKMRDIQEFNKVRFLSILLIIMIIIIKVILKCYY